MSDELETTTPAAAGASLPVESGPILPVGPPPRTAASHRGAFNLVYALLGLIAVGAIAALVIVLTRPGEPVPPPWSSFVPAASGSAGAQQIADHVAARYGFADGQPLVSITSEPLALADEPVQGIILREVDTLGREQDLILEPGGAYAYTLCGGGDGCAIDRGEPSRDRLRVLSLGALELALYSFRYLDAQSVVAFMPPTQGAVPEVALFFRRAQLQPLVDRPLAETVPNRAPTPENVSAAQAESIDALTSDAIYRYQYRTLQATPTLVLSNPALPALQELFPAAPDSSQSG